MTDYNLEQRLKTALDHAAPDDLDGVLSRCVTGKGTVSEMNNKVTSIHKKKPFVWMVAACMAVMLVGGGGMGYYQANAVASVVSLDVNPSIELTINKKETVLSCTPLNEDAVQVLAEMELEGVQLDVAVNAIVGSLLQNGYLDSLSSAILISVEDQDSDRAATLRQELTGTVDSALKAAAANASVLSQTVEKDNDLTTIAKEYNISTGKAALVNQVIALNSSLKFDQLSALSVEELRDLAKMGAPGMPIGKSEALAIAKEYSGLTDTSITAWDVDAELDEKTPHYEVELDTKSKDYEYIIDAYTGAVLSGTKDVPSATSTPGASSGSTSTTKDIGVDGAKKAALAHAGLKESQVTGLTAKADWDDGQLEYDVEFFCNNYEYDYEIKGTDGTVLHYEKESRDDDDDYSPDYLTAQQAKELALKHAGVSLSDMRDMNIRRYYDDGKVSYTLNFWHDDTRYNYTVDGNAGTVVSHSSAAEEWTTSSSSSSNNGNGYGNSSDKSNGNGSSNGNSGNKAGADIGSAAAKSAAFVHAGLSESDVTELEVERDVDDGRIEYEIEFECGNLDYEYTIDGATGAILEYEIDD